MARALDYYTMKRLHLTNEGLLNYTGARECLLVVQDIPTDDNGDFERHRRFYRNQSQWTVKFFSTINPLLWPVWYDYIYNHEYLHYFDLSFKHKICWYSTDFSKYSEKINLKRLTEFWDVEKPTSQDLFLIEVKSLRIRELIFDRVSYFFALNDPSYNVFFDQLSTPIAHTDPSWRLWGLRSTKLFSLSAEEVFGFEKLILNLIDFLEKLQEWP